jgi:hypothetical protein
MHYLLFPTSTASLQLSRHSAIGPPDPGKVVIPGLSIGDRIQALLTKTPVEHLDVPALLEQAQH